MFMDLVSSRRKDSAPFGDKIAGRTRQVPVAPAIVAERKLAEIRRAAAPHPPPPAAADGPEQRAKPWPLGAEKAKGANSTGNIELLRAKN